MFPSVSSYFFVTFHCFIRTEFAPESGKFHFYSFFFFFFLESVFFNNVNNNNNDSTFCEKTTSMEDTFIRKRFSLEKLMSDTDIYVPSYISH